MKISRGDIVLLPITFVSGQGSKVRPALIVQEDSLNQRLNSTIVAIITSTNRRSSIEPTQLLVEVAGSEGRRTGLLHDSTIKAEHLDTIDQRDILRVIGQLSESRMREFEGCMKAALKITS